MTDKLVRKEIGAAAFMNSVRADKFKSDRITVNLVTPLKKETAAVNALVSFVLRKGCRSCPDFTELNKKLAEMYGAILDSDVSKQGDMQVIELSIQYIDDRFALDGEDMTGEAANLLADIVFAPNLDENGLFPQKDLELEREYLIDTINSELNEKRTYALGKAAGLVFGDEPFGVKRYGYVEDAEKITGAELSAAWRSLIKKSRVEIMFTGPGDPDAAEKVFTERLSAAEREPEEARRAPILPYTEYREAEEKMEIVQGKLVMAFRMGAPETEREKNAARVFSALYGATPFSKLFMNVREKLSLCYYVVSHFERSTGVMFVDCGIEFESMKPAREEILRQLELVKSGDFSDEEIADTKLIIRNSLGTVEDSLGGIEGWYLTCIIDGFIVTPEEDGESIEKIMREDIVSVAEKAKLAAEFFLDGMEAKA